MARNVNQRKAADRENSAPRTIPLPDLADFVAG
jgi:hypothetical protein